MFKRLLTLARAVLSYDHPITTRFVPPVRTYKSPKLIMTLPRALFQGSKTQEREHRRGVTARWRVRRIQDRNLRSAAWIQRLRSLRERLIELLLSGGEARPMDDIGYWIRKEEQNVHEYFPSSVRNFRLQEGSSPRSWYR